MWMLGVRMFFGMCVAVLLQCSAVYCSVMQFIEVCRYVFYCGCSARWYFLKNLFGSDVAVFGGVLWCVAMCYGVLQYDATADAWRAGHTCGMTHSHV